MTRARERTLARRLATVVAAVMCAIALVACERPQDGCPELFGLEPGDGPAVGLVVDRTGSAPRFRLPEAVAEAIRLASADAGRVSVLAVDGPDAAPRWVLQDAALNDPGLDPDTDRFDRIVDLAAGCVAEAIAEAEPTSAGSDVLTAVQRMADSVADDPEAHVAVLTDGLANAGPLDLDLVAVAETPVEALVDALRSAGQLPGFGGQVVELHGIGQTAGEPVAQPVREWLRALWSEICLRGGGQGCAAPPADVPVDASEAVPPGGAADAPVAVPAVDGVTVPGGCTWSIGSALLFDGDSAHLRPGAAESLTPIATALRSPGTRAEVVGHTSTAGSPEGRATTSRLRARAVVDLLVSLGVPPEHLAHVGVGAERPLVDDRDAAGELVESAAARNRRVDITVTGVAGCGR
ncbi:OmpA family protein [Blastococcus sp. SYSU DS1021]